MEMWPFVSKRRPRVRHPLKTSVAVSEAEAECFSDDPQIPFQDHKESGRSLQAESNRLKKKKKKNYHILTW